MILEFQMTYGLHTIIKNVKEIHKTYVDGLSRRRLRASMGLNIPQSPIAYLIYSIETRSHYLQQDSFWKHRQWTMKQIWLETFSDVNYILNDGRI